MLSLLALVVGQQAAYALEPDAREEALAEIETELMVEVSDVNVATIPTRTEFGEEFLRLSVTAPDIELFGTLTDNDWFASDAQASVIFRNRFLTKASMRVFSMKKHNFAPDRYNEDPLSIVDMLFRSGAVAMETTYFDLDFETLYDEPEYDTRPNYIERCQFQGKRLFGKTGLMITLPTETLGNEKLHRQVWIHSTSSQEHYPNLLVVVFRNSVRPGTDPYQAFEPLLNTFKLTTK